MVGYLVPLWFFQPGFLVIQDWLAGFIQDLNKAVGWLTVTLNNLSVDHFDLVALGQFVSLKGLNRAIIFKR